jgi:hypothetical protein
MFPAFQLDKKEFPIKFGQVFALLKHHHDHEIQVHFVISVLIMYFVVS